MTQSLDLEALLTQLIAAWESEVIEFKEANDNFSTSDIGKYFSALANEANLKGENQAWLVFGVQNRTRQVVGTDYRNAPERLQQLKMQITQNTDPGLTFRYIHELHHAKGRLLLFEIPAAPRGIPIAWNGHYYSRSGESLVSLGLDKLDEIRQQTLSLDWSAQVLPSATLESLDPDAISAARHAFAQKHANNQRLTAEEILNWSLETFLERARLTQNAQITRTTILLLGKRESAYLLNPHPVELTWRLFAEERAYQHFGPPFFLNTTELYRKIRNFQIRLLPKNSLMPIEVPKYEQKMVLEAMHNCIAHQDYSCNARIIVSEYTDKLAFENEGVFFEGVPDDYLGGDKTPRHYRNPFLVQAMAELNMIDTMGYGIYQMHQRQIARFLPLPDYDLSEPNTVKMILYGNVVDLAYSQLLMEKTNLALTEILALDRIQKKLPVPDETLRQLRKAGLVEGKKPHLHISSAIAQATNNQVQYIKTRLQNDAFYQKLVLDYLAQFGQASRKDIDELLINKLPESFNIKQKSNKIGDLLSNLRRSGKIKNTGSRTAPQWRLGDE